MILIVCLILIKTKGFYVVKRRLGMEADLLIRIKKSTVSKQIESQWNVEHVVVFFLVTYFFLISDTNKHSTVYHENKSITKGSWKRTRKRADDRVPWWAIWIAQVGVHNEIIGKLISVTRNVCEFDRITRSEILLCFNLASGNRTRSNRTKLLFISEKRPYAGGHKQRVSLTIQCKVTITIWKL